MKTAQFLYFLYFKQVARDLQSYQDFVCIKPAAVYHENLLGAKLQFICFNSVPAFDEV